VPYALRRQRLRSWAPLSTGSYRVNAPLLRALPWLLLGASSLLYAQGLRTVEPGETIDAREITRIFSADPALPHTRSIRKVETATEGSAHGVALRVPFALNSAAIPAASRPQLDAVAQGLVALAGSPHIEIDGHTDATGTDRYNNALSLRRAEAVRDYLVVRGVERHWLTTRGLGNSELLRKDAPNAAENRRVEFRRIS
jgi:outer membrane protein OmpA-like peptidoglycan-associated protein